MMKTDSTLSAIIADLLPACSRDRPLVLGLSGPQGAGKSTVCGHIRAQVGDGFEVLSLDDFYLTEAERGALAQRISPLLAMRGPPGTHDVGLLRATLHALRHRPFAPVDVPLFDKVRDDRTPIEAWRRVTTPPSCILLEGWCVGALTPADFIQSPPLNDVEAMDRDGAWRAFQRQQLDGPYRALWGDVDAFIHMVALDPVAILAWRTQQEAQTLGVALEDLPAERRAWVARFVQYFERLTLAMAAGSRLAGAEVQLDAARAVIRVERPV